MKRNLIYHCCPLAGNDGWQANVRQLLKRVDVFDGRRVVAIATGTGMVKASDVERAFGKGFEFIHWPNCPRLREVATFLVLLQEIASTGPEATFYAHTKGNSTAGNKRGAIRWRNAMYHHLLDRWQECIEQLKTFAAVGTTKMFFGAGRPPYPSKLQHGTWLFAGTFFWLNHERVFTHPHWQFVPEDRYGAEAWLGGLFQPAECATVFQPWNANGLSNPYDPKHYPAEFDA